MTERAQSIRLGSREIYYGWVIVAAAVSVTETVTWGIIYYGFPVFLRPMEQDLGASRVAITAAFSIGLGVAAVAARAASLVVASLSVLIAGAGVKVEE